MATNATTSRSKNIRIDELIDDELLMLNIVNKKGEMDDHYTVNWNKARFIEKVAYYDSVSKSLLLSSKGKRLLESYRLSKKYSLLNYRKSHLEDIIYYMQQLINEKNEEKKKKLIKQRIDENVIELNNNTFNELYESAKSYYCVSTIKEREIMIRDLDDKLKTSESIKLLCDLRSELNNDELMRHILIAFYKQLKEEKCE